MNKITTIFLINLLLLLSCTEQTKTKKEPTTYVSTIKEIQSAPIKYEKDSIIKEHLQNGAWKKGLYSRDWQEEIDKGLAKDSTIAYLWQQKAMPLFKQRKYEIGLSFLDKAVKYDRKGWQAYRAFIKCIFIKTYKDAIEDFEDCKARFGNDYVQDHSYDFYIAVSKLQLNEFEEAEAILKKDIVQQKKERGEDWAHHLDIFYLGISQYEQRKYELAIQTFEEAVKLYPQFAEAQYYTGLCLIALDKKEEGKEIITKAIENGKQGFSINEDNELYELYPYQIRWEHY